MKKVFFGMLACMLLNGAAFAGGGKKSNSKKVAKSANCNKANCPAGCDKSKCIDMPGCICQ
jgi:hypothetical protein